MKKRQRRRMRMRRSRGRRGMRRRRRRPSVWPPAGRDRRQEPEGPIWFPNQKSMTVVRRWRRSAVHSGVEWGGGARCTVQGAGVEEQGRMRTNHRLKTGIIN